MPATDKVVEQVRYCKVSLGTQRIKKILSFTSTYCRVPLDDQNVETVENPLGHEVSGRQSHDSTSDDDDVVECRHIFPVELGLVILFEGLVN